MEPITTFLSRLSKHPHQKWIYRAIDSLTRLSDYELERLDWKILSATLIDMEKGFQTFHPYRHIRKIAVFGSARTPEKAPEYQLAYDFSELVTKHGFMVITGGGGGIMAAANAGAGHQKSFGLNIHLPHEQNANEYIEDDPKLIRFKYFFTRKLFFLLESDAVALFPGGFGTQDEALETLTLCQTGKYGPVPLVLIDHPHGSYWRDWDSYLRKNLVGNKLISPDDTSLYKITDNIEDAYDTIAKFYQVYHSSRYVNDLLVIRLKIEICDSDIDRLNYQFADILAKGKISKSSVLEKEKGDHTEHLPRLILHFNQRDYARLYQMIWMINDMTGESCELFHPEQK